MTMYGADPVALRELSRRFLATAEKLDRDVSGLGPAIESSPWDGPDAQKFKDEWKSTLGPKAKVTAEGIRSAAAALNRNADEQEKASDTYLGNGPVTPPGTLPGQPVPGTRGDTSFWDMWDEIEDVLLPWDVGSAIHDLWKFGDTIKDISQWSLLKDYMSTLGLTDDAARSMRSILAAQMDNFKDVHFSPAGYQAMSTGAKVLNVAGGALGIIGGLNSMINPTHAGEWRELPDRISGGLSVASGAIAIAACFTPVGPVVVAAGVAMGLASAAWDIGNMIYDNWDSISEWGSKVVSDPVGAVGDLVSGAGNAISGAASAVGNFFGGLFR